MKCAQQCIKSGTPAVFVDTANDKQVYKRVKWFYPVLVVSTDCSDHLIQQMLALGAKGYLPEPFTREALREKLECLPGAAYV